MDEAGHCSGVSFFILVGAAPGAAFHARAAPAATTRWGPPTASAFRRGSWHRAATLDLMPSCANCAHWHLLQPGSPRWVASQLHQRAALPWTGGARASSGGLIDAHPASTGQCYGLVVVAPIPPALRWQAAPRRLSILERPGDSRLCPD